MFTEEEIGKATINTRTEEKDSSIGRINDDISKTREKDEQQYGKQ